MNRELVTKWLDRIGNSNIDKWYYYDINGEEYVIEIDNHRLSYVEMVEFCSLESFLINHKYVLYQENDRHSEYNLTDFGKYYLNQTVERQEYLVVKNLLNEAFLAEERAHDAYLRLQEETNDLRILERQAWITSGYRGFVRTFDNEDDIINNNE